MEKEINQVAHSNIMRCNCCGKVSFNPENLCGWYQFSTFQNSSGHNIKHYKVCSMECYLQIVKISVEELGSNRESEIDGMNIGFAQKLLSFFKN